jgi:hypothetical protein
MTDDGLSLARRMARERDERFAQLRKEEARCVALVAERDALLSAAQDLLRNQLSISSGGDPGMVFDSFDADVERRRNGTVSFDREAVDRFKSVVQPGHRASPLTPGTG